MERSKHYVPRTKAELIRWCKHRFPYAVDEYKKMKKNQLQAIVFNTFRKHEEITNGSKS